jgi:hypothetical protein
MQKTPLRRSLARVFARDPHRLVPVASLAQGEVERLQATLADIGIPVTVVGQPVAYSPFAATARHRVLVPASQVRTAKAVLATA